MIALIESLVILHLVYGMHPRAVLELSDLRGMEKKSVEGEEFSIAMKDVHDQVKETLKKNVSKYKEKVDLKRSVQYKVGDLVFAYLRKETLPKGRYTKLHMKKIGPCKIIHKFGENAYEISLPPRVAIPPIFNLVDLFPLRDLLMQVQVHKLLRIGYKTCHHLNASN